MLIRCPDCGFTRQVNAQHIPDCSALATCPTCQQRIRLRNVDAETTLTPEAVITPA